MAILDSYLKATGQDQPATPTLAPPPPKGADASGGTEAAKPVTGNVPGGQTQPTQPETTGDFWSFRGPGWSPTAQGLSDWATVAGAQQPYAAAYARTMGRQTPGDLVKMRADVEAARQRLGPFGATSADVAGAELNPTNLLTAVPVVGPGLAGAAQSAFTDYGWGKDPTTVGKDALLGFGAGYGTKLAASPKVAGPIVGGLTGAGGGWLAGHLLGGGGLEGAGLGSLLGLGEALRSAAKGAGGWTEQALDNPETQRALQQLLYGGAFSARARNDGNWLPGQ
jgi:hypothetical protein